MTEGQYKRKAIQEEVGVNHDNIDDCHRAAHYDFENDIQVNWKKIIKARKTLLKMSVNRMMSRSQFVYNAVRFLILCKNAVRHNQCLLFFVL